MLLYYVTATYTHLASSMLYVTIGSFLMEGPGHPPGMT